MKILNTYLVATACPTVEVEVDHLDIGKLQRGKPVEHHIDWSTAENIGRAGQSGFGVTVKYVVKLGKCRCTSCRTTFNEPLQLMDKPMAADLACPYCYSQSFYIRANNPKLEEAYV